MTWQGREKRIFAPSAAFLSVKYIIYQPQNKNRLKRKFGGNNDENSNNNQHNLCSLIRRLVRRRACRHLPWRVVAHRDGGNMLHNVRSVTKGD